MTKILVMMITFVSAFSYADFRFVRDHENLFRDQVACKGSDYKAAKAFKQMFASFKKDYEAQKRPVVEIADYGAYTTRLVYKNSECQIQRHDGCFSAYCE